MPDEVDLAGVSEPCESFLDTWAICSDILGRQGEPINTKDSLVVDTDLSDAALAL